MIDRLAVLRGFIRGALLRDALCRVAACMERDRISCCAFTAHECEGVIKTGFRYYSVGFYSGMHFTAEIEDEEGKAVASFIFDSSGFHQECLAALPGREDIRIRTMSVAPWFRENVHSQDIRPS